MFIDFSCCCSQGKGCSLGVCESGSGVVAFEVLSWRKFLQFSSEQRDMTISQICGDVNVALLYRAEFWSLLNAFSGYYFFWSVEYCFASCIYIY